MGITMYTSLIRAWTPKCLPLMTEAPSYDCLIRLLLYSKPHLSSTCIILSVRPDAAGLARGTQLETQKVYSPNFHWTVGSWFGNNKYNNKFKQGKKKTNSIIQLQQRWITIKIIISNGLSGTFICLKMEAIHPTLNVNIATVSDWAKPKWNVSV